MKLRGTPQTLDVVLRPLVRIVQLIVGVSGSALLALLGLWWWMPLPLATSFVVYELLFWLRADQPVLLLLDHPMRIEDAKRRLAIQVDLTRITNATAQRRTRGDSADLRIVLGDDDGTRAALWLRVPATAPSLPFEVDADLGDHLIGGDHGSLRAIAGSNQIARQRIDAPVAAVHWFSANIPQLAWQRTAVRLWRGAEPPLDLLGHHTGLPDALAVFDADSMTLNGTRHPLVWTQGRRVERDAMLLHAGRGIDDTFAPDRLSVVVFCIDGVEIAAPSRILLADCEASPAGDDLLHTHSAEATAMLMHLLRVLPPKEHPPEISAAARDAAALTAALND